MSLRRWVPHFPAFCDHQTEASPLKLGTISIDSVPAPPIHARTELPAEVGVTPCQAGADRPARQDAHLDGACPSTILRPSVRSMGRGHDPQSGEWRSVFLVAIAVWALDLRFMRARIAASGQRSNVPDMH